MAGLLIIAHAPLASALRAVGAHVYPEVPLLALDVAPDTRTEVAEDQARELLARVRDPEALILTDVFGATPAKVAGALADGVLVRVVTGVNVPMLWRAMCYRSESMERLVARAIDGATQGVMRVGATPPQNQSIRASEDDQVHTHHQQ